MKYFQFVIGLLLTLVFSAGHAFEFSVFGDTTYVSGNDENNNFSIGQLDFVSQPSLSEKSYVIIDFVLEATDEGIETEIERLSINRTLTEGLEVGIGRYMQPLGFWNHNFAHASLAQDTVSRPFFIAIEHHEKSFLPSHLVGLVVRGETESWTYQLGVGNTDSMDTSAVASTTGPATVKPSDSHAPSDDLTTLFRTTFEATDNLTFGLMVGKHNFTESSEDLAGLVEFGEVLFEEKFASLDFSYNGESFYTFGEVYAMQFDDNQDITTGASPNPDTYEGRVYYVQTGYRMTNNLTLAARYEKLDFDDNATIFTIENIVPLKESVLAIKYMLEDSNALRLEAKRTEPDVGDAETIYSLQWFFFLL